MTTISVTIMPALFPSPATDASALTDV